MTKPDYKNEFSDLCGKFVALVSTIPSVAMARRWGGWLCRGSHGQICALPWNGFHLPHPT